MRIRLLIYAPYIERWADFLRMMRSLKPPPFSAEWPRAPAEVLKLDGHRSCRDSKRRTEVWPV